MGNKVKPMDPHRSGWCLKLPVTEWNQERHDKCPKNFPSSVCECPCNHVGERSLESRGMTWNPYVPPKAAKIEPTEEDNDD